MLISRLEQLGDLLEDEMKADKPPTMKLSRIIVQMSTDLDAHRIPHPNWHGLDTMPILAWIGYRHDSCRNTLPAPRTAPAPASPARARGSIPNSRIVVR